MYDFLLQTSFFLSIGVIIFLMARAVPRVEESDTVIEGRLDRFFKKLPLHQIDEWLNAVFTKLLRRIKVTVLRLDNLINRSLSKLKKSNGNSQNKEDLFKIENGDKKE